MSDIEHYMTRCSELSRENDALQARVVELEKQLEREYIRTRHARAQTEVRDDEITSLKSALNDYERMVVASEARIAALEAEVAQKAAVKELPSSQPIALRDVPFGSIIETNDGIRACVSEYVYTNDVDSQRQCILLASGEYAHFDKGNDEIVRVIDLAALATAKAERDKAVESIRECRTYLRGCMNHAFDETPIVEVAKDVNAEFHRNRYQLQCMAKERDNIAKERDAANLLLKRLMCVVVPDNAVPNDMKEFVRDSAATVLKDLWDYLKTDADLRKAEHDAR